MHAAGPTAPSCWLAYSSQKDLFGRGPSFNLHQSFDNLLTSRLGPLKF